MAQLVNRPRGTHTRLLLTGLFLAQSETSSDGRWRNRHELSYDSRQYPTWLDLVPDSGTNDQQQRRQRTGLNRLAEMGLIERRAPRSWRGWRLLAEDGSGRPYTVPTSDFVAVDAHFWTNGWVHQLTPQETAVYLMVLTHRAVVGVPNHVGVAIPSDTRRRIYGITDEVYSAQHNLCRLGLLTRTDLLNGYPRPGRVDPNAAAQHSQSGNNYLAPFRFSVAPGGLDLHAADFILGRAGVSAS